MNIKLETEKKTAIWLLLANYVCFSGFFCVSIFFHAFDIMAVRGTNAVSNVVSHGDRTVPRSDWASESVLSYDEKILGAPEKYLK
ncbi:hypothetical protein GDO81_004575 [Engystomops pustulosus]|uniref:Uncharacterized protein n=1 Tax=Engystomops pustulosus TaxID=76066 RepID=A0AAV6ZVM4_ENGPU|nr:hypothetical protein GDO81_004575 [Engystomops pustulosus]